jgi:uncharacterized protein (TIGR03083 family)
MTADSLDYVAHLARESDRFAEVLLGADPMQPVPSCPDWSTVDLFWHLTEVQWFWGTVVHERVDDPERISAPRPVRPSDLDTLGHLFATVSAALEDALAAPPETAVWTWAATDRTVGFVRRRQAHEALVHRVDAELATGSLTGIDPELATDGVDEVLRTMFGAEPGDDFGAAAGPVRVECTDTGATWLVTPGTVGDEQAVSVAEATGPSGPDDQAVATVRGTAGDLDCWLWGRLSADKVERGGDEDALAALQAVVDRGID